MLMNVTTPHARGITSASDAMQLSTIRILSASPSRPMRMLSSREGAGYEVRRRRNGTEGAYGDGDGGAASDGVLPSETPFGKRHRFPFPFPPPAIRNFREELHFIERPRLRHILFFDAPRRYNLLGVKAVDST